LKRKTAEVSSMAALFRKKPKPSPFEEAARKDSAVHVSLSSDSPVKQPGTSRSLSLACKRGPARKPTKLEPPTTSRRPCPTISEELQRRAIAP
jgi:hypothetical protein